MYIYCIYITYILQRSVCPKVLYYIRRCQSPNPKGMHCFKLEFCVQFVHLFKERNASVK